MTARRPQAIHSRSITDLAGELFSKGRDDSIEESLRISVGRFIAQTFAALAELEREETRERQRGGIEAAKRAGRHLGRPPKLTGAQIREAEKMLLDDRPASEVAGLFRVHPRTLKAATRR